MENKILTSMIKYFKSPGFYVSIISIVAGILLILIIQSIIKKIIIADANNIVAKRRNTIVILMNNIFKYLIIIIIFIICLSVNGVNVTAFLTGLGVAGAIAGLALQDALKDIIAGINIIMDNYFVVGDIVEFNGFTGNVIEFGLKSTKILGLDGKTLVVANREISKIYNLSLKDKKLFLTYSTAYEEDVDKVTDIFEDICKKLSKIDGVKDEVSLLGVNELNDSSVDFSISITCDAKDQHRVRREANKIVKRELDKNKIKIPYTQVEVHDGK
jgi:small conductance mechanosensitive channel